MLISIWAEESMQNKLGKVHQNCDVFERIAHEMSDVGYEKVMKAMKDHNNEPNS